MPAFKPVAERFWPKVDTSGGPDACWPWLASVNVARQGYGQFQVRPGIMRGAHRVAYELVVGPIPEGMTLDHLCRNPPCVNPAHLEPVTLAENIRRTSKPACKRGHPRTPTHVRIKTNGRRDCRTCAAIRQREKRAAA